MHHMVTMREGARVKKHQKQEPVPVEDLLHHSEAQMPQKIVGRNYFVEYQGMTLCKFKGDKETYIFVVPAYIEEWEKKILDYGILIAYRRGMDIWREMDHIQSPRHKEYNSPMSLTCQEKARCKDKIEIHYEFMMSFEAAKKHVEKGLPFLTIEERAGISKPFTRLEETAAETPKLQQMAEATPVGQKPQTPTKVDDVEMWNGRAVFRTEAGAPYHREDTHCCVPGCKHRIELRSYICRNDQLEFTTVRPKVPADDRVEVIGAGRGKKDYKCPDCVAGIPVQQQQKVELTEEQKELAKTLELFTVDNMVLNDLKYLADHPDLADGEMLRGAVQMACSLLLGGA